MRCAFPAASRASQTPALPPHTTLCRADTIAYSQAEQNKRQRTPGGAQRNVNAPSTPAPTLPKKKSTSVLRTVEDLEEWLAEVSEEADATLLQQSTVRVLHLIPTAQRVSVCLVYLDCVCAAQYHPATERQQDRSITSNFPAQRRQSFAPRHGLRRSPIARRYHACR